MSTACSSCRTGPVFRRNTRNPFCARYFDLPITIATSCTRRSPSNRLSLSRSPPRDARLGPDDHRNHSGKDAQRKNLDGCCVDFTLASAPIDLQLLEPW